MVKNNKQIRKKRSAVAGQLAEQKAKYFSLKEKKSSAGENKLK